MKNLKQSTRECPKCGNIHLIRLFSMNKKICTDCRPHRYIPWYLEEGQTPLISCGR